MKQAAHGKPSILRLTGLLLAGLAASWPVHATPVPQVEAGLDDFRHARFAEALADWRQAAAAGDARGALYVGVLYDSGVGVSRNYQTAMAWYRSAAAEGSAVAAFNIGVLYDGGFGVSPDQTEAAAWYAKAAAAGFGRAEYNLALLYEYGAGVPQDRARAVELFRSAAAQGLSAASEHLASMHHAAAPDSHRPPPAPAPATPLEDFQRAQQALLNRGPVDAARATKLFRRAAERHNAVAEYDLGYCYEHGLGVRADPAEAARWYHRAAGDTVDGSLRSMAQTSAITVSLHPAQ